MMKKLLVLHVHGFLLALLLQGSNGAQESEHSCSWASTDRRCRKSILEDSINKISKLECPLPNSDNFLHIVRPRKAFDPDGGFVDYIFECPVPQTDNLRSGSDKPQKCMATSDEKKIGNACDTLFFVSLMPDVGDLGFRPPNSEIYPAFKTEFKREMLQKRLGMYDIPWVVENHESADKFPNMHDQDFVDQLFGVMSMDPSVRYFFPYILFGDTSHVLRTKGMTLESALRNTPAYLEALEQVFLKIEGPEGPQRLADIKKIPNAPALLFVSSANGPSARLDLTMMLMKEHIPIDYIGRQLHKQNHHLPHWWAARNKGHDPSHHSHILKQMLVSQYPFFLAFENSLCPYYITEKLWQPLLVGSIPVYLGTTDVFKLLPHRDAIIHIQDFKNISHLTGYLHSLIKDPKKREKHQKWRNVAFQPGFYQHNVPLSEDNTVLCKMCLDIRSGITRNATYRREHGVRAIPPCEEKFWCPGKQLEFSYDGIQDGSAVTECHGTGAQGPAIYDV